MLLQAFLQCLPSLFPTPPYPSPPYLFPSLPPFPPFPQVREAQEAMVVLDRCHALKVQAIQKEYQDFMERIRNKAQGAIDSANRCGPAAQGGREAYRLVALGVGSCTRALQSSSPRSPFTRLQVYTTSIWTPPCPVRPRPAPS